MQICAGCDRPILDRFLLNVLDRAWHIRCVQCSDCRVPLTEKCFSRDGQLYCKNDFFMRFGTKCAGCLLGISPSDLVRKARDKVFHLKCFTCMMCRKELSTGEELYILDENKFICKDDYLASKFAGSDDDGEFETMDNHESNDKDYSCSISAVTECDGMDNKHEIYLRNGTDPSHLNNEFNNQLNSNCISNPSLNSPNDQSMCLPLSPVSRHLPDIKASHNSVNSNSPDIKDEPMDQHSDSCPSPGPQSPESQILSNLNPGSNCSSLDTNDTNNNSNSNGKDGKTGSKRRGPRTTIKAKQLEVLKVSFNATPKPTRHIREQLAAETGLSMRVIQVWFQNRRSKERRMKQLSALGARRHFFRSPRRMRALRAGMSPSELDESEMMGPGYGYFNENGQEFYPGYPGPGYGDFFPGQGPELPPGMALLPPGGRGTPPMGMDHPLHPAHMVPEGQYLPPDMMPQGSPEPMMHPDDQYLMASLPPRSLPIQQFPPHSVENW